MLELRQIDWKGALRGAVQQAPDRRSAIALRGVRAKRVAGLEREVLLDAVNGGEIVVLDFAQLQEAKTKKSLVSCSAQLDAARHWTGGNRALTSHKPWATRQPKGQ